MLSMEILKKFEIECQLRKLSKRIAGREYDPFACMDELLCALLTVGHRYAKGEEISLPVVDFCCRTGNSDLKPPSSKRYMTTTL